METLLKQETNLIASSESSELCKVQFNALLAYHTVDHEIVDVKFILIKFWLNSFAQQVAPGYSASVHQSSDAHTSDGQSHRNGARQPMGKVIVMTHVSNSCKNNSKIECHHKYSTLTPPPKKKKWIRD